MRDTPTPKQPRWERDLRSVYRHEVRKRTMVPHDWHLAVSREFAMEIRGYFDNPSFSVNIDVNTRDVTWQGIPVRVDPDLPPGCFMFKEGVLYD